MLRRYWRRRVRPAPFSPLRSIISSVGWGAQSLKRWPSPGSGPRTSGASACLINSRRWQARRTICAHCMDSTRRAFAARSVRQWAVVREPREESPNPATSTLAVYFRLVTLNSPFPRHSLLSTQHFLWEVFVDWKVRFIDYPQQYQKMRDDILAVVDDTLSRGDVMMRQQMVDFENHLAQFVGTKHAIGVSNCTDGLHLTLRAAGIQPGDEVITVSHTFVATAAAIHHAGATPVLVDIGDDHNIDVGKVEAAITPRTRAIIPVHLNGRLSQMDTLMALAEKHHLLVIEDTAQALGASLNSKKGGDWGLAGCFSFYPAKLLGAYGDAGAVVTSDDALAERIRLLRNHGRTPEGDIAEWSFNCRLDNLHAAILDLKLKHVPDWIERRRQIAALYDEHLSELPQLLLPPPPSADSDGGFFDVYQNYEVEAEGRDALRAHLTTAGIETMIPWGGKGVHQFEALGLPPVSLPRTERMFQRALMLPMHCELADEQVVYVAEAIRQFYAG